MVFFAAASLATDINFFKFYAVIFKESTHCGALRVDELQVELASLSEQVKALFLC